MILSLDYDEDLTRKYIKHVVYTLNSNFPSTVTVTEPPFLLSRTSPSFFTVTAEVHFHPWTKTTPTTISHDLCLSGKGEIREVKLDPLDDLSEVVRALKKVGNKKVDEWDVQHWLQEDKLRPVSNMLQMKTHQDGSPMNRSIIGPTNEFNVIATSRGTSRNVKVKGS